MSLLEIPYWWLFDLQATYLSNPLSRYLALSLPRSLSPSLLLSHSLSLPLSPALSLSLSPSLWPPSCQWSCQPCRLPFKTSDPQFASSPVLSLLHPVTDLHPLLLKTVTASGRYGVPASDQVTISGDQRAAALFIVPLIIDTISKGFSGCVSPGPMKSLLRMWVFWGATVTRRECGRQTETGQRRSFSSLSGRHRSKQRVDWKV